MRGLRADALIVLGWFVLAGLVAGLVWWQVTPVPSWVRTGDSATLDESSMAQLVSIDGWFATIAAVGGLLSGVALTLWRSQRPVATVLLVGLGACVASALMWATGHQLGTHDLDAALQAAAVGDKVPDELTPRAHGVFLIWPAAGLLGALGVLWVTNPASPPPAG